MKSGELTVFVRIALYMLTGRAVAGGWLPEDVAGELTSPEVIELTVAALMGAVALVWYWASKARKAVRELVR